MRSRQAGGMPAVGTRRIELGISRLGQTDEARDPLAIERYWLVLTAARNWAGAAIDVPSVTVTEEVTEAGSTWR